MSATASLALGMPRIPLLAGKPPGGKPSGGTVFDKNAIGYFFRRPPRFFGAAWLSALAAAALSSLLEFGSVRTREAAEAAFFPVFRCFGIFQTSF